ncbi:MAG: M60 family metallopeptidase [Chitinophaga sp.]
MSTSSYSFVLAAILLGAACKKSSPVITQEEEKPKPVIEQATTARADSLITVSETFSGTAEAKRLGQSFPASDFTPTGFYLPPNATLKVNVEQVSGDKLPVLLVGTYSRYTSKWNPQEVQLKTGENTVIDPLGGLLYLRFTATAPGSSSAKVRFVSGQKPVPFYQLGKTTHTDWMEALKIMKDVPDVQLVSNRTIMVASRANALAYQVEDQDALLRLADRVINIEDSISGLDGSAPSENVNVHKYLMTETDNADYYMVATWYRTAYYQNTLAAVLTVNGLGKDGWGPWHELGHMHQQGAWTWGALGEVTVNVYSLAVERKFGITPSRLKKDNVWPKVDTYFAKPDAERDFNGDGTDVWVRLCMFHQLWMAYGDAFYHRLHKAARQEKPVLADDAAKMKWFMLTACSISGHDLSGFFRQWGMRPGERAYTAIAALNLPAPATDPSTLREN